MYPRLQMFRPTISNRVTQGWGENRACIDRRSGKVYGVSSQCRAGDQSVYESFSMKGHNGLDIGGLTGADIYHCATFDGWMKTESDRQGGIGVDVISDKPVFFAGAIPQEIANTAMAYNLQGIDGFIHYVKIRYWHLKAPVGHDGKKITCGTVIGLMGNTGVSSGVHLHFAPKWCDKNGRALGSNNGYFGAFDPTPYTTMNITAKDHSDTAVPLTPAEIKDIESKLGAVKMVLIALQKIIYNL